MLTLGVIGTATKENEKRAPIHPKHFDRLPAEVRRFIYVEKGYGLRFGVSDEEISALVAGMLTREELFATCDAVLLPKPTSKDLEFFREGQVLFGWPHIVQGEPITQEGIDKKMTYVAFEAMFQWHKGIKGLHVFHKNNEMAGYSAVMHAMQLRGMTGCYGHPLRAAVIGFGSVGRGATHALQGMGIKDITVYTSRPQHLVACPFPGLHQGQYVRGEDQVYVIAKDGTRTPMIDDLAGYDVIALAVLQDPKRPYMFVQGEEMRKKLRKPCLIVDISCDKGMGFDFAKPTSFEDPMFTVGDNVTYYAVDHSPSAYWMASTEEVSEACLPYVPIVMGGPEAWDKDETVRRSLEIRDGVVQNPDVFVFQHREEAYPHRKL